MSCPRRIILISILAAAAFAGPAYAHKGRHASPSPSASPSASVPPNSPVDPASGASTPTSAAAPATPAPKAAPPPFRLDVRDAFFGHLHNKIVHFPLAFGLASAVILMASGRWPGYAPAGRALLVVAALLALAAYFTGEEQQDVFRGTPLWDAAETHELLGKASGLLLGAGAVLSRWKPAQRWLWILGLLIFVSLSMTGFLGGVLSHTEP